MLGVVEVDLMIRLLRAGNVVFEHLTASNQVLNDCML